MTVYTAPQVYAQVAAIIADVHARPRFTDRSLIVDDGFHDVRHIAKGGYWNATDLDRAAYGYTKQDVADLRRALRGIGVTMSLDECDALLVQCEMGVLAPKRVRGTAKPAGDPEEKRERWRLARAARRQKARDEGRCIICLGPDVLPEKRTTCDECGQRANDAKARRKGNR